MRIIAPALLLFLACSGSGTGSGSGGAREPEEDEDSLPAATPVACSELHDRVARDWQPDKAGPDLPPIKESAEKAAARQRLRARQAEVCTDMCLRVSDCQCEDAARNKPELLADDPRVPPEKLLIKSADECMATCNGEALMTPDQRKRLVACFPEEACGAFVDCTSKALATP